MHVNFKDRSLTVLEPYWHLTYRLYIVHTETHTHTHTHTDNLDKSIIPVIPYVYLAEIMRSCR